MSAPAPATDGDVGRGEWRAVLALLEVVGTVEARPGWRFLVTVGTDTETLERPRHKDIDTQQVVDLRRMLSNAGYGPLQRTTTDGYAAVNDPRGIVVIAGAAPRGEAWNRLAHRTPCRCSPA